MDQSVVTQRAASLLELLDLTEDANTLVADYSYGMSKKVAIACALLHNPRVLVLDEPFAGIDPVARQVLESTLHRYTAGAGPWSSRITPWTLSSVCATSSWSSRKGV